MPDDRERQQIADFLAKSRLEQIASTLRRAYDRPDAHVWQAGLYTRSGDARLELLVYPLGDDPALIAEYEEELTALERETRGRHGGGARVAVLEGRTPDFAIIVTTSASEAEIVTRYLGKDKADGPALRTSLTYHPQLDRLFGGDFVREVEGHWVQACLLSLPRAQLLYPAMLALDDAYTVAYPPSSRDPKSTSRPYPVPLAVFQLDRYGIESRGTRADVSIPDLFTIGSLAAAPPEYHALAQMHAVIPGITRLQEQPLSAREAVPFARQLFRIVGCGHRQVGATFTRAAGCCLRPESITPAGELTDLYFFTRAAGEFTPAELREHQYTDLFNAFSVLYNESSASGARLEPGLAEALMAYLGTGSMTSDIRRLTAGIASEIEAGAPGSRTPGEALAVLAGGALDLIR